MILARRPARSGAAWAVPVGAALLTEVGLRGLYAGAPVLGQRLCEGYGWLALLALLLVLPARALRLGAHRRMLGLSAFGFAAAHLLYAHFGVFGGDPLGVAFLSPSRQLGTALGALALLGLLPLAATSTDAARRRLGPRWKRLHAITPALLVLSSLHTVWVGVHGQTGPGAALTLAATVAALWLRHRRSRT